MMEIQYAERILVFLINLFGFWLMLWVYQSDRNKELNRWFILMTFFDLMWVDCAFWGYNSGQEYISTMCYRLNFAFVALFLIALYYFLVLYFFEEKNKHILLERVVLIWGIALVFLSLLTDTIIKNTVIRDWGAEIEFGKLDDLLFNTYAFFMACLVVKVLIEKYVHLPKDKKLRVQYFSVGIFFFIMFNVIFNIIFPSIFGTVEYARFGDYSAIILLVFSAYAITKHNLMGVRVLLAQVLIVVMSIVLAVDTFFLSDNFSIQILKTFVLLTFIYYGRALVLSMQKENENTEKIKRTNLILGERNRDLHVLLEVSDKVNQDLDSKKISQDIVDSIPESLKHLGYVLGMIVLYKSEKDCVYVYAVTNSLLTRKMEIEANASITNFRERLSKNDDLIVKAVKNGKMYASDEVGIFLENFMGADKSREVQRVINARSLLSVPLFSAGKVIGAIIFLNQNNLDSITKRNKVIVKAFAAHIGPAIENAKLYEKTNVQMKELSVLNRDLKKANTRLKEVMELKDEFLHITSHQLRTPLTAIRGMILMWVDGDYDKLSPKEKDEILRRIYISADRLNNITNEMLDALELEGRLFEMEFKKVSLMEMINSAISTLRPDYERKGLYLRLGKVDKDIPEIGAEPNYMSQVFLNLIDNACKYTRTGGTEIDVRNSGRFVDVYIKDTGIGMDKKVIKKAYEKFTRGENAVQENASGSGLGLFIAKKVLDAHNGKIAVHSAGPGKGTTFKVSLLINQKQTYDRGNHEDITKRDK